MKAPATSDQKIKRPRYPGMRAADWEELAGHYQRLSQYYEQELRSLRTGIEAHATDTVWSGTAETAVDAITRILDDHHE